MEGFADIFSIFMATGSLLMLAVSLFVLLLPKVKFSFTKKVKTFLENQGPTILFMTAFFAVMGSLIYSDVLGMEPCQLCWYQRIVMYPLPVLLGYAMYKKDVKSLLPYLQILIIIGLVISVYQYLSQMLPGFATITKIAESCGVSGPACTDTYIEAFGFVTIPLMSVAAFWFMLTLVRGIRKA